MVGGQPVPAASSTASRRELLSTIAGVCLLGLLGFTHDTIIQPVLPLMVLDAGLDAAFVGLLVAAYGIPTILLRPTIGRLLDGWSHAGIHRAGAAVIAVAPLGYLLPLGAVTLLVRGVQGLGWAGYGAATHALLAKLAPVNRRGEASGYFNATHALAVLLGPAAGLWLYQNVALAAPFLLASAVGLAALLVSLRTRIPQAQPAHAPVGVRRRRSLGALFEPSAVLPMTLVATFQSIQSLFLIFAPVYATATGIPIEALGLYYPAYGAVILVGQLTLGRLSDRYGRRLTVVAGNSLAAIGVGAVALLGGFGGLLLGACLYGIGNALVTSTLGAMTIDRALPGRLGAATATYSLGYALGASTGGAVWGVVISTAGYPWPFVGGMIVLAGCALAAAGLLRPRPTPAPA